jgi:hypothetical protein
VFRQGAMPAQDATSPGMLADSPAARTQTHAGLGNAEEVQRTLRRAKEHYTQTQEALEGWAGVIMLPDRSVLPAGRAHAYSRLAVHDQHQHRTTSSQISSRR